VPQTRRRYALHMAETVRKLTPGDLAAVDAIQRVAYRPSFRVTVAVFGDKLARYPRGCWASEAEGRLSGYLLSHPGYFSAPPCLNTSLDDRAEEPDCYFIHDVAFAPGSRGKGVVGRLVALALARAAGCHVSTVALVAVSGADGDWERAGFARVPEGEPGAEGAAKRHDYARSQATSRRKNSAESSASLPPIRSPRHAIRS